MPDSNNKGGRKPRVSDEDLLEVFRSTSDPVLSTAEVAEQVPIKRRGTLNRLQGLEEDGELASKQIGGRNTVWWAAAAEATSQKDDFDARDLQGDPATTLDAPTERDGDTSDGAEHDADGRANARRDEQTGETIDDVVERVSSNWDDRGKKIEKRKAAARAVLEYAREHGEVSKQRAIGEFEPEYSVDGQNPDVWYRQNVRPVLREACEYDSSTRSYHFTLARSEEDNA